MLPFWNVHWKESDGHRCQCVLGANKALHAPIPAKAPSFG